MPADLAELLRVLAGLAGEAGPLRADVEAAGWQLHLFIRPVGSPGAVDSPVPPVPWHSDDFRRVAWPGLGSFTLTPTQAKVVAALWQAWEDGIPETGQRELLDAAGSQSVRLADVFKNSPAWRRLVVSPAPGFYRLPERPPPPAEAIDPEEGPR